MDDAGLQLCKEDPELMQRLGEDNIFDMKPGKFCLLFYASLYYCYKTNT